MKVLLLIFILFSCGQKVDKTPIKDISDELVETTISTQSMGFNYENSIDIFVAFLWPEKISTSSQQDAIEKVLKLGRDLRAGNEELLGSTFEFKELRCEQIFSGEIDATYEEEEFCYELENKKLSLTVEMLEKVTTMETLVREMGGEWLESNQDFDTHENSKINFNTRNLSFFSMGHELIDDKKVPLPYPKLPFEIKSVGHFSFIELFFPRKNGSGIYKIKADLNFQKYSLIFQGDLDLVKDNKTRRGIIYWQILKKSARL